MFDSHSQHAVPGKKLNQQHIFDNKHHQLLELRDYLLLVHHQQQDFTP